MEIKGERTGNPNWRSHRQQGGKNPWQRRVLQAGRSETNRDGKESAALNTGDWGRGLPAETLIKKCEGRIKRRSPILKRRGHITLRKERDSRGGFQARNGQIRKSADCKKPERKEKKCGERQCSGPRNVDVGSISRRGRETKGKKELRLKNCWEKKGRKPKSRSHRG